MTEYPGAIPDSPQDSRMRMQPAAYFSFESLEQLYAPEKADMRYPVTWSGGGKCVVDEFDDNVFVVHPGGHPLALDDFLKITKLLYKQGFRDYTIIVRWARCYEVFSCTDAWGPRNQYVPHSPKLRELAMEGQDD